ncbi:MAG: FAD-binding protein [Oscillospiraceae bacterium]|nr:FAD-binding protein [Oscillospiraceae bacterium]
MKKYDVIIVGAGAAGLSAAINLSRDLKVLVLCKGDKELCNSNLAQGGIAGVYNSPDDSPELHKQDTFVAGGFENDPVTTDILVNEAKTDIAKLIELGVEFDKKEDGDYHRTLEGGHGRHRIFHNADATGHEIVIKLQAAVKELENVDFIDNSLLCSIKKVNGGFVLDVLKDGEYETYCCQYTVMCTGGIGRVYEFTTNSAIATGDGIAFAYNMGARIKHLSYIQFHPTAFNNKNTRECFLISEAVRGEGAYLRNCHKERFMHNYDKRLELAPRDVVSHSIIFEAKRTGSDDFYIDITHKDSEFIKNRFPMIYSNLLKAGYDLTTDLVPIFPCQHYLMGGIDVDVNSQSSVDGLYACGECSHTGVHGNNRLASNSLLEALVFSRRAAEHINERRFDSSFNPSYEFLHDENAPEKPKGVRTKIRSIMQKSYFVMPDVNALFDGFNEVKEIKEMLERGKFKVDKDYVEARALATVAYIILKEAIAIASENAEITRSNVK